MYIRYKKHLNYNILVKNLEDDIIRKNIGNEFQFYEPKSVFIF